jgi:hypothetical protein
MSKSHTVLSKTSTDEIRTSFPTPVKDRFGISVFPINQKYRALVTLFLSFCGLFMAQ